MAAVIIAIGSLWYSWTWYDNDQRPDGNDGHTAIDFGGQYLMGRMLLQGHGRHLYNRNYQRQMLQEVYLKEFEDPHQETSDVERLMGWFMGKDHPEVFGSLMLPLASRQELDAAILLSCGKGYWRQAEFQAAIEAPGGPLYPPIHCFFTLPFAYFRPQLAYRIAQILNLACAILAALVVPYLSRGGNRGHNCPRSPRIRSPQVWWPVAISLILLFPGFSGSMNLGQNSPFSLALLMWGWLLMIRGHPIWGGALWGLLAYKPVWAVQFFFVLLLGQHWLAGLAMLGTGSLLAAATLAFVGWHSWSHWLYVGREAARTAYYDENWIDLSRELLNVPRRWLDFEAPAMERLNNPTVAVIGWGLFGACLAVTLVIAFLARRHVLASTGPGPAFLMLGGWLTCFHFMYYDVLLAALPIFLVLADSEYLRGPNPGAGKYHLAWPISWWLLFVILFPTPLFYPLGLPSLPYDTFCLLAIWLWCGGYLLRRAAHGVSG
jgi:hypothetical protein